MEVNHQVDRQEQGSEQELEDFRKALGVEDRLQVVPDAAPPIARFTGQPPEAVFQVGEQAEASPTSMATAQTSAGR